MDFMYRQMLVEANEVWNYYNLAAGLASWIVLAGLFISPGTFTSLKSSRVLQQSENG